MNKSLQRVMIIGLLSHALTFTTLYVILNGLITDGSKFVPAFLGTAVLMAVVAFFTLRDPGSDRRLRFFVLGLLVIGLGVGCLAWIDATDMVEALLLLVIVGLFMWRRMLYMVENIAYLRQALLDHYRFDVVMLVLATVVTLFVGRETGWETRMLPFFISFMITRMFALSMASQLNNSNRSKSVGVLLQNNMPFLFVGGVLMLTWMISVIGGPLAELFSWILSPLFYLMGFLVQLVMSLFGDTIREAMQKAYGHLGEIEKLAPQDEDLVAAGQHFVSDWFLYVLVVAAVALAVWYFYRQMQQITRLQLDAGVVEVREFIHEETANAIPRPRSLFSGPLTPMRKTYRRFLMSMKKSGHLRGEGETASEYIQKVAGKHPELNAPMQELTDYYMRERYGAHSVDDKQQRADQLSDELARDSDKEKK